MSSSTTTTMRMNSIMSASVLASVAETVSARDADVGRRAKKPRQTPGLKSHRGRCEFPGVHAVRSSEVSCSAPSSSYHGPSGRR